MTSLLRTAVLTTALFAPLTAGFAPAAFGAESADQPRTLITVKSDRGDGVHSPRALALLAALAAESDD